VGEPRAVADPLAGFGAAGKMQVAVSPSGLLLYSSSNHVSQFTWFDRDGTRRGTLAEPGEYEAFRLSADGRRVAAQRNRPGGSDIWLLDAERGISSRFTFNSTNTYPVWSPDGGTIVFTRSRTLLRKEASGAGGEQPIGQGAQYALDWSRDRRAILYMEVAPGTQRDLWIMPVPAQGKPGDAKPRLYLRTPFNEAFGRFSPEATPRWVAYQSDESGRYEIYIDSFPEPRGKTRISTSGGAYPQWSADGRELFYLSPEFKLIAVGLKAGAGAIEPSTPRELFPLPAMDTGWSPYDVAPDGRFLVRATPEHQVPQPLTVIVNWPALLKKGAAEP